MKNRKLAAALSLGTLFTLSSFGSRAEDPKPLGRPMGGMAMKPVICVAVEAARGKTGQELAGALEQEVLQLARSNYQLSALLPGDPPVACFHSTVDNSKLPRGAR